MKTNKKIIKYSKPLIKEKKIAINKFFQSYRGAVPDFHSIGFGRLLASGGCSSGCSSTGDSFLCSLY